MTNASLLLIIVLVGGCVAFDNKDRTQPTTINPGNDSLLFEGRIKHTPDSSTIYYSGSGVTFRFRGTSAAVWLRDETGDSYFNVIVDGNLRYIRPDTIQRKIPLNTIPLEDTVHTVSVVKRNEWANGRTWFYGVTLEGGELLPPPVRTRTIEFFGNSITAGYAIDDNTGGDSPDSIFTNNYFTYAAITARHFNANYYCTARSGIGIMVSWFPLIMPDIYDRLDPFDPQSKWDFASAQPDIVVINLLQNDSWLVNMPEHESFRRAFGNKAPSEQEIIKAYRSFVEKVRSAYPNTHIICALGSMDATKEGSPWPGYVASAVSQTGDAKIYTYLFPYTNKGGHPRRDDNKKMAESLITFIETRIWTD